MIRPTPLRRSANVWSLVKTADKAVLIRFVASPDGQLIADLNEKLGGRGAWVRADRDCLTQALSGNKFGRHLKQKLVVNDGFLDHLERRLGDQVIAGCR